MRHNRRSHLALALLAAFVPSLALAGITSDQGAGSTTVRPWPVQGSTQPSASPVVTMSTSAQRAAFGAVLTATEVPITFLDFPYNVNSNLSTSTTANGGTVTQANSKAVLQTSAAANGSAQLESRDRARYVPGQGMRVRLTAIFTACVAGSTQEVGIGDTTDGFFFSCNGSTFSIDRRQNGSDNFTAQASWNGTVPSGFDITKGNVYQIVYQWLGFGAIRFYIEDSVTGDLTLVHTIQYANTATSPTVFNPSLPLHLRAVNTGNTTNLTLQTSSMSVVAEGPRLPDIGNRESSTNLKAGITTALTDILALQNRTTFNGATNRTMIRLDNVSARNSLKNDAVLQLVKNATLGGVPSFTNVDTTNSIAAVDTAGTTVTGGITVFSIAFLSGSSQTIDLTPYNITLAPGDTMTCAMAADAATADVRCALNWIEDF